tara:strand:- start:21 stop:602 length:582 start_codon:yes stop_codon:yes gene_type:complete
MFRRMMILSRRECEDIKNIILSQENSIKRMGPDIYSATSPDSLTGRYRYFNFFLDSKFRSIMQPKLLAVYERLKLPKPMIIQCWANTFRTGEGIGWHKHWGEDSSFGPDFHSVNIFIDGDRSIGTSYRINGREKKFRNRYGQMSLFSPTIEHCVFPNHGNQTRISIAMDIHFSKETIWDKPLFPHRYFYLDTP